MLGTRLSQRAGAALPRRALNRAPAQIARDDAVRPRCRNCRMVCFFAGVQFALDGYG
jgi:hypothetical protein